MKKIILFLLVILLIISGFFYKKYYDNQQILKAELERSTFYDGIVINGIDVSNQTYDEVLNKITDNVLAELQKKLNIKLDNLNFDPSMGDLGLLASIKPVVDEAYNYNRSGDIKNRINVLEDLKKDKKSFNTIYTVDEGLLKKKLQEISLQIPKEKINPQIDFDNGQLIIIKGQAGYKFDEQLLYDDIKNKLYSLDNSDYIISAEKDGNISDDGSLSRINGIIGTFSTDLGRGTRGRNENIRLSASRISNIILQPNEEISFNKMMGEITTQNGYKMASTIQNGKYVDSLGGGLCQTSTTLYNALIRSDVQILERHPHSIPAPYVPIGEDGAVWVGTKDLKFKNNWDFPIAITSKIENNKIIFNIYGDTNVKNYEIQIYSKIVQTTPATVVEKETDQLELGKTRVVRPKHNGLKVYTYKKYIKDGKVIKEELYNKSNYPVINGIVEKGSLNVNTENEDDNSEDYIDLFQ